MRVRRSTSIRVIQSLTHWIGQGPVVVSWRASDHARLRDGGGRGPAVLAQVALDSEQVRAHGLTGVAGLTASDRLENALVLRQPTFEAHPRTCERPERRGERAVDRLCHLAQDRVASRA